MRVVFAGTPDFAVPAFEALRAAGHDLVAVMTQPDRPAGRGQALRASPVKQAALAAGIPVMQPASLREPGSIEPVAALRPDVLVVVAYGLLLPEPFLRVAPHGALNIHASLLPRWRGAAPIQRAILAGDARTGVSIMQMERGLDTGPVILAESIAIGTDETAGQLHDRLSALGARLIVQVLERAAAGPLEAAAQPVEGVTHAAKILKAEALVDWRQPAQTVLRTLRAFAPAPGAGAQIAGALVKLHQASPGGPVQGLAPGTVVSLDGGVEVACVDRTVVISRLQSAGGRVQAADEWLRGHRLQVGDRFDAGPLA
jgi:methionyl-tRNA formyltransferase